MTTFRLHRRALLRGAGGIAIALPWLEIMGVERSSHAAALPAKRFLTVYTPGGTVLEKWTPQATGETLGALSPILAPLEAQKQRLLVLGDLDMTSAVGEQRQSGMIALLTGMPQPSTPSGSFGTGPSIDQTLVSRLSAGKKAPSLQLAIRWGVGKSFGKPTASNILNYTTPAPASPITPELDPSVVWKKLFGTLPAQPTGTAAWDKSILDAVDKRYVKLGQRLGGADKARLDQHLTSLRALEKSVASIAMPATCVPPTLVDTSDYNPTSATLAQTVYSYDPTSDAAMPKVGKLMMDMMVMAFACDLTAVGTLQWSDSEARVTFPFLGLTEGQHFYENDGGYRPVELEKIFTWYSMQHAYLLEQLAQIDVGGHSLLDETVVFFGSHLQSPATYSKKSMPFLLAGGGGGLRGGRYLTYAHRSHNDLLSGICNLFGDPRTTFGGAQYCTTPIGNLT